MNASGDPWAPEEGAATLCRQIVNERTRAVVALSKVIATERGAWETPETFRNFHVTYETLVGGEHKVGVLRELVSDSDFEPTIARLVAEGWKISERHEMPLPDGFEVGVAVMLSIPEADGRVRGTARLPEGSRDVMFKNGSEEARFAMLAIEQHRRRPRTMGLEGPVAPSITMPEWRAREFLVT